MTPADTLLSLGRLAALQLNPQPTYIHKPRPDGSGVALKLNLRIEMVYAEKEGVTFLDRKATKQQSGLFLDIAPQVGKTEDGKNATFGWDSDGLLTTKLGKADLLNILTSIREIRRGRPVPTALRPRNEADAAKQATTMALFHKFGTGSTAINWQFTGEGGSLSVSKSKTARKSVNLSLMEEFQIESYMAIALDAILRVGL